MTEIEATINLIACALHQKKPNPADVPDLEGLLRFAVRQSVAALLGSLLTDNGLLSGSDREEWSELFFKNLRKTLAFDAERKKLEAALDEANITYFADYLVEFAKTTQFVVVTHRKGTMERCDALYGVAMEEKGVSSMVSVNLENYS